MIDYNDTELFSGPPSINMRLARIEDAEYIYSLRVNPDFNEHLSPPPPSVKAQADFLSRYVEREWARQEFYFIIENKEKDISCGTVRLYNFSPDSFCWGSWILDHSKPRTAAVESALFVYDFAFGLLGVPSTHFEVRKKNTRVIAFHQRFGAVVTHEDELNLYFRLNPESLCEKLPGLTALTPYRFLRFHAGKAASIA